MKKRHVYNPLEKTELLFVYGTLRPVDSPLRDYSAPHREHVGRGVVKGTLYYLGGFPGLLMNSSKNVIGDVLRIHPQELDSLDSYEGYDPNNHQRSLYLRKQTDVLMDSGQTLKNCWIYIFNQPIRDYPIIESGDYLAVS